MRSQMFLTNNGKTPYSLTTAGIRHLIELHLTGFADTVLSSTWRQDLPPANRLWLAEGSDDRLAFFINKVFLN